MFTPTAKIIKDSISPDGVRITSMEITHNRFVLSELNCHGSMVRNGASSRAIPLKKSIERTWNDPAYPLYYGINQAGMSASEELGQRDREAVQVYLKNMLRGTIEDVEYLAKHFNLHKQTLNRYLEPFAVQTTLITATDWDNFFVQRCHKDAQPEFREVAMEMQYQYYTGYPTRLDWGEWHTPYYNDTAISEEGKKISAARCARLSYLTHDGNIDPNKDLDLYNKLISAEVVHASPLEHVATPSRDGLYHKYIGSKLFDREIPVYRLNRLKGWNTFRHEIQDALPPIKFTINHPELIRMGITN